MQYKHKLVIAIIQECNLLLDSTVQKYFTAYKEHFALNYAFVISNNFSIELENDLKIFQSKNYFEKKRYALDLTVTDKLNIQKFKNHFLQNIDLPNNNYQQNKLSEKILFTIGYESKSIDSYINQLVQNDVRCLVDVRKNAYSNKFGFKKNDLTNCLNSCDIVYIHISDLGIESQARKKAGAGIYNKFDNNLSLFAEDNYSVSDLFSDYKENLDKKEKSLLYLEEIIEKYKHIALTCFELKHFNCHRNIIANYFEKFRIVHL